MAADRTTYARQQARLLHSLISGEGFPEGFAAEEAARASLLLRRKRGHEVSASWPALAHTLGDQYEPRFDAFARTVAAPAVGGALADGLAFARGLPVSLLSEQARVEVLLARARLARGPFFAAIALHEPRRVLVVVRVALVGVRKLVLVGR